MRLIEYKLTAHSARPGSIDSLKRMFVEVGFEKWQVLGMSFELYRQKD